MKFAFTGALRDAHDDEERFTLVFEHGKLSGDLRAMLVAKARAEALARRGKQVGPPGGKQRDPRATGDPQAVYWLLRHHVFDPRGLVITGKLPDTPGSF